MVYIVSIELAILVQLPNLTNSGALQHLNTVWPKVCGESSGYRQWQFTASTGRTTFVLTPSLITSYLDRLVKAMRRHHNVTQRNLTRFSQHLALAS